MMRIVVAMNQTLDGIIDHDAMTPDPALFAHWTDFVRSLSGSIYGRVLYETMRYWDEDQPDWTPEHHVFAEAWRAQPKWVVSRSLHSVGPNATLLTGDVVQQLRALKARLDGVVQLGGPVLAASLAGEGIVDEYHLYIHSVVAGRGKPYFPVPPPDLRLLSHDRIAAEVVRLVYAPR